MTSKKKRGIEMSNDKKMHAIGLGPTAEETFVFGVQYVFDAKMVDYDRARHEEGFEYAPIFNVMGTGVVRVVKKDKYFIGTDDEIKKFVDFIKAGQFGDSCYSFDGRDIYDDGILTMFEPMDLLHLGYYIESVYGDNIDVYYHEHTHDMFVIIRQIVPGSEHIVHFPNKVNHKMFANFMNRYAYVSLV